MGVHSKSSDRFTQETEPASAESSTAVYDRIARMAHHLTGGEPVLLACGRSEGFELGAAVGCTVCDAALVSEQLANLWQEIRVPGGEYSVREVHTAEGRVERIAGLQKAFTARLVATWAKEKAESYGILCVLGQVGRPLKQQNREAMLELAGMALDVEGPMPETQPDLADQSGVLASLMELQFEFARNDIEKGDLPTPIARRVAGLVPARLVVVGIAEDGEIVASAVEGADEGGPTDVAAWYNQALGKESCFVMSAERSQVRTEAAQIHLGIPVRRGSRCVGVIGFAGVPLQEERGVRQILSLLAEVVGNEIERYYEREALRQSEERHRTLLAQLPVGVYRSTPEGRILEANEAMADLVGSPDVATLRRVVVDDLFVDYRDRIHQMERLGEEETGVTEFQLRRLDGAKVWVRDHPRAIRDEDGEVVHYDGVIVDVSKRRLAERLLAESEARLRAITEHVSDVIAIFDESGRASYVSGAAEEVFGLPPHVLEGKAGLEYVHDDDRGKLHRALATSLSRPGQVIEVEFRFCRADRRWAYLNLRGKNLIHQPGIEGILCVIRDVTEKKQFEKQLVDAKEKAEEMARAKSTFLANMSHEIRTPLTGILGFAEVLAEEVGEQHQEFVELIQQGGHRLSETLNSVLDLAKLQAGEVQLDLEPVALSEIMCEAVQFFEPVSEKKNLPLQVECPNTQLVVRGDEAGLGRILANLLSNAIKFTEEGCVAIRAFEEEDIAGIEVEDTGIGMREDFLAHLFEEFKQESTGLNRTHEGAGLGLTITKRLVEMMDGSIDVQSEKGKGTTFRVELPKCKTGEESGNEEVSASSDDVSAAPAKSRILVVEDNRDSRRLIEHLLAEYWELHIVSNAADALCAVDDTLFDLLLVDINLGVGLDGTDLLRRVRSKESYAQTPAIALTAFAMPGDKERFLAEGFDDYIAKPFTREALIETIERALAQANK